MSNGQNTRSLLPKYIACYVSFAVIVLISVWLLLQLRVVIVQVGLLLDFSRYAMTVLDQFGFIVLGVLWLIAFLSIEGYLRNGVQRNQLRPRVAKVFFAELLLMILVYALQALPVT